MHFKSISLLFSLFLLTAFGSLTPSSNFTVSNFVRSWNLVGYYSTTDPESVTYYSCGSFNVTQGSLGVLYLNIHYLDATTSKFVDNTLEVLPNPLNPGMLVSTTAPIAQNNFAVVYDNNETETVILVNYAQDLAFVLSQFEFFYYDAANVEYFLNQSGISYNSTTALTNTNCSPAPLIPIPNFDASILKGKFHGIAMFNGMNDTSCYDTYFTYNATMMNFTQVYTVGEDQVNYFTDLIVDSDMPSILIAAFCPYDWPFVVVYQHAESNTIVIMAKENGYILSTQVLISDKVISEAQQAIVAQGYTINSTNFHKMDLKCFLQEEDTIIA